MLAIELESNMDFETAETVEKRKSNWKYSHFCMIDMFLTTLDTILRAKTLPNGIKEGLHAYIQLARRAGEYCFIPSLEKNLDSVILDFYNYFYTNANIQSITEFNMCDNLMPFYGSRISFNMGAIWIFLTHEEKLIIKNVIKTAFSFVCTKVIATHYNLYYNHDFYILSKKYT
jgi:hypothetical protein